MHPRAAYSSSKFEAEQRLLPMADKHFCPVVLRKGTVYGWSPRMRFDLVVNTFLKDALTRGRITIHYGGEMWRPLVDVRDAARAYIACIEADDDKVRGQIFNVIYRNMRISELALRVKDVLAENGLTIEITPDYGYTGVRNYRVSARKIAQVLDFRPVVTIEESVANALEQAARPEPARSSRSRATTTSAGSSCSRRPRPCSARKARCSAFREERARERHRARAAQRPVDSRPSYTRCGRNACIRRGRRTSGVKRQVATRLRPDGAGAPLPRHAPSVRSPAASFPSAGPAAARGAAREPARWRCAPAGRHGCPAQQARVEVPTERPGRLT